MFPIVFSALLLIAIVGVPFFAYFKYVNISNTTARKIEIIGYVLLISVIFWEFVLKNIDMSDFLISDSYYTVEKINYIYILIEKICNALEIDTSTTNNFFSLKTSDYLHSQILATNIIEAILQILSTAFIAIGRLQELKNSKK